jgi:hypothetical protein
VGAHAGGFNSETTGVASLGTHTTSGIGAAEETKLEKWLAWKLAYHHVGDPRKYVRLLSSGFSGSPYPAGSHARVHRIAGHRNLDSTDCPGGRLYDQLPKIRRRTQARIAAARSTP